MANITTLEDASEGSTYPVIVAVHDKVTGDPITPNDDITWTLTDGRGNVVNGRSNVPITPPDTTFTIVCYGDDLIIGGHGPRRYVTVKCTFDSVFGDGKPIVQSYTFKIQDQPVTP